MIKIQNKQYKMKNNKMMSDEQEKKEKSKYKRLLKFWLQKCENGIVETKFKINSIL